MVNEKKAEMHRLRGGFFLACKYFYKLSLRKMENIAKLGCTTPDDLARRSEMVEYRSFLVVRAWVPQCWQRGHFDDCLWCRGGRPLCYRTFSSIPGRYPLGC